MASSARATTELGSSSAFFSFEKKLRRLVDIYRVKILASAFHQFRRAGLRRDPPSDDPRSSTPRRLEESGTVGSVGKLSRLLEGLSSKFNDEEFSAISQACHEAVEQISRSYTTPTRKSRLQQGLDPIGVGLNHRDQLVAHIESLESQVRFLRDGKRRADEKNREQSHRYSMQVQELQAIANRAREERDQYYSQLLDKDKALESALVHLTTAQDELRRLAMGRARTHSSEVADENGLLDRHSRFTSQQLSNLSAQVVALRGELMQERRQRAVECDQLIGEKAQLQNKAARLQRTVDQLREQIHWSENATNQEPSSTNRPLSNPSPGPVRSIRNPLLQQQQQLHVHVSRDSRNGRSKSPALGTRGTTSRERMVYSQDTSPLHPSRQPHATPTPSSSQLPSRPYALNGSMADKDDEENDEHAVRVQSASSGATGRDAASPTRISHVELAEERVFEEVDTLWTLANSSMISVRPSGAHLEISRVDMVGSLEAGPSARDAAEAPGNSYPGDERSGENLEHAKASLASPRASGANRQAPEPRGETSEPPVSSEIWQRLLKADLVREASYDTSPDASGVAPFRKLPLHLVDSAGNELLAQDVRAVLPVLQKALDSHRDLVSEFNSLLASYEEQRRGHADMLAGYKDSIQDSVCSEFDLKTQLHALTCENDRLHSLVHKYEVQRSQQLQAPPPPVAAWQSVDWMTVVAERGLLALADELLAQLNPSGDEAASTQVVVATEAVHRLVLALRTAYQMHSQEITRMLAQSETARLLVSQRDLELSQKDAAIKNLEQRLQLAQTTSMQGTPRTDFSQADEGAIAQLYRKLEATQKGLEDLQQQQQQQQQQRLPYQRPPHPSAALPFAKMREEGSVASPGSEDVGRSAAEDLDYVSGLRSRLDTLQQVLTDDDLQPFRQSRRPPVAVSHSAVGYGERNHLRGEENDSVQLGAAEAAAHYASGPISSSSQEWQQIVNANRQLQEELRRSEVRARMLSEQIQSVPMSLSVAQAEKRVMEAKLVKAAEAYEVNVQRIQAHAVRQIQEVRTFLELEKRDKADLEEKVRDQAATIHQLTHHLKLLQSHSLVASQTTVLGTTLGSQRSTSSFYKFAPEHTSSHLPHASLSTPLGLLPENEIPPAPWDPAALPRMQALGTSFSTFT